MNPFKSFARWWRRLGEPLNLDGPAPAPKTEINRVDPFTIRLSQWRNNPDLVKEAQKLSEMEFFKAQIEVLKTESPAWEIMPGSASATERIAQQARIEGYTKCLKNLQLMSNPAKLPERLEATFDPPEEK